MKKIKKMAAVFSAVFVIACVVMAVPATALAADGDEEAVVVETVEEEAEEETSGNEIVAKAISAGIAIAVVATAGAIGMSMAISKSVESISRQPEAEGGIRTSLMLGLVFIETAIIYALIIAILIIFVL